MALTRRQFLKWAGATGVGAVVFNGCRVPDHEIQVQSPAEIPEDLVTGRDNFYATVAQLGSASEGLLVRVMEGRAKKVEGNPDYPVNTGKHHVRSESLLQAAYHPDRIQSPLVRIAKGGPFRPITWPEALTRLSDLLGGADPASVLLATAPVRGTLADVTKRFASDYGATLMGFEPLDMVTLRAAIKNTFGQDAIPKFDIANADYIVSFGADFLGTWLDATHFMRGYGEFRQGAGRERGHLVHIDPRFSVTAASADEWIPVTPGSNPATNTSINPGTEGLLAMAMMQTIISEGLGDKAAADKLTAGENDRLAAFAPSKLSGQIGLPAERISELARTFASHAHPLAIGGGAAGAHTNGLFNLTAIYALNYLVGAVDKEGGVIFNPSARQSIVKSSSLRDWKATLASMRAGDIKVVLVRDADLIHGLPVSLDPEGALGSVETVVSFSSFLDDTTAKADLILPGHTQLEEWGTDTPDVGPGYMTVAFQQPVINRFRDTMPFGDVLINVAGSLGNTMPWGSMRDAVRAAAKDLHDASSDATSSFTRPTFEEFWKRALERGCFWDKGPSTGKTATPPLMPRTVASPHISGDASEYPLSLAPFEGHGMGTGSYAHLPWLQALPDPITTVVWKTWVELNPQTAVRYNVRNEDVVVVESSTGKFIRVPVYVNPATPPGVAAIPMGQGHSQYTSYAAGRGANVLDIIDPAEDEATGGWAWAATRVRITKTNQREKLSKMEGIEPSVQLDGEPVIEVFRPGESSTGH